MTKRLLIDASHAEETRVVVLDGNRLEDFDVETQSRRQLKGNIYLAKVVRVEPSLQAAFVEYGGNRHGFLAFGEIHPDYYQIPVADRQRLIAMQEEEARAEEEEDEDDAPLQSPYIPAAEMDAPATDAPALETGSASPVIEDGAPETATDLAPADTAPADNGSGDSQPGDFEPAAITETAAGEPGFEQETQPLLIPQASIQADFAEPEPPESVASGAELDPESIEPAVPHQDSGSPEAAGNGDRDRVRQIDGEDAPPPEIVGGEPEGGDETRAPRQPSRFMRSYKIQEVIRRRQILLIQVVKEERGTKGAALTTYISLAGRYCVLMPNSPRGGGISRKITSTADRRRLKEVTAELEIPRGMGLIVRTAGAARPKPEIKRDGEYLLRLWDDIREQTMASMAPSLIYEEASLIKRAIRDVYSRDVDELLVDGEEGWRAARDYMRMLMPTHVKKVQLWPANAQPLFAHSQVEAMLDAMLNPTVQLRSGGYLVINQTEALVAIDVNSGRSTRERGIEETALRTNLEAAEEAARQLRLRDLAGLIVIDFIDMESKKHNSMVERRMADSLKNDRARIQIGNISHFGLLELSRQRLRPSLAETSLNVCAQCGGTGHVRSTESAALHVLREIEEEGGKRRAAEILVHVASSTALYILNHKRQRLTEIEARYAMLVCFAPDESLLPAQTRIDRLRAAVPQDQLPPLVQPQPIPDNDTDEADIADDQDDVVFQPQAASPAPPAALPAPPPATGDFTTDADHVPGESAAEGEQRRRRRRRRRRGGRREDGAPMEAAASIADGTEQPDIADLVFAGDMDAAADSPVPGHDEASEAASDMSPGVPAAEVAAGEAPAVDAQPTNAQPTDAHSFDAQPGDAQHGVAQHGEAQPVEAQPGDAQPVEATLPGLEAEGEPARAKRGRRGGRRRRKPGEETDATDADAGTPQDDALAAAPAYTPPAYAPPAYVPYAGPTPADPFAMAGLDIFDAIEQAEQLVAKRVVATPPPPEMKSEPAAPEPETPVTPVVIVDEAPHPAAEAAEPVTGTAVQPVMVGSTDASAPARKGWWRRS